MATQRLEADGGGRPILLKSAAAGPDADRLRREAVALRLAAHPGVVQLVGLDDADDGSVALRLAVAGTRTFADLRDDLVGAARALAGLATTIADLHDLGLVHGRVTADHVVLDGTGRAVLCGFADAGPRGELDPAEDVLGLGGLLGSILSRVDADGGWEPIPERRFGRGDRWLGFVRRALLTLADHATDDDPARRPTARGFAASVLASLPPATSGHRPAPLPDLAAGVARLRRALGGAPPPVVSGAAAPSGAAPPRGRTGTEAGTEAGTGTGERPGAATSPGRTVAEEPLDDLDAIAMLEGPRPSAGVRRRPRVPVAGVRALVTPLAAALGLGLLVFGVGALLRPAPGPSSSLAASNPPTTAGASPEPAGGPTTSPTTPSSSPTSPSSASTSAASTSGSNPPTPPPPVSGSTAAGCGSAPPPAADPDGDGCPSTVRIGDAVVEVDGVRYGVGRPGDLLAVGDWDCDGVATVALVHRGSGEVFLFDGWATGGAEATATSLGTVPGAESVEVPGGPDGCGRLVVVDAVGERTEVLA